MGCPVMLSAIANELGFAVRGDVSVSSLNTDTRTVAAGDLFVALKGPNFDGHAFAEQARDKGAAALVVDHWLDTNLPQLLVTDTRIALGQLGRMWRLRSSAIVLGVTGSNGKTTTKEMLAAILSRKGKTLATAGNLNNDIGVPLMLSRIQPEHEFAVIEMGANHAGEIAYSASLALPSIGLITNVGPAHLEGFGSMAGIARAKGEMFAAVSGAGGICVVNQDDEYANVWRDIIGTGRAITFGFMPGVDVSAEQTSTENLWRFITPSGSAEILMPLPGRHNVTNALAAVAAAYAAGASMDHIKAGLQELKPVKGRLIKQRSAIGAVILDDTYNANYASLMAGIAVLLEDSSHAKWLVLGDMGELGEYTQRTHRQAGEVARESGVERLFAFGPNCVEAVAAFGDGASHFSNIDTLIAAVQQELTSDTAVLVKGSRSMRMERVVQALMPSASNSITAPAEG